MFNTERTYSCRSRAIGEGADAGIRVERYGSAACGYPLRRGPAVESGCDGSTSARPLGG